jgi:hypothetical protein
MSRRPSTPTLGSTRFVAVFVAAGLIAAGCGNGDTTEAGDGGATGVETGTETDAGTAINAVDAAKQTTTTATVIVEDDSLTYEPGVDELAFTAGELPTTTMVTTTTTAGGSTTTAGSGGKPVTTSGGGGGGDTSIYTGLLGAIGPDEVMAPAVVPPPTVAAGIMPLTGLPGDVPNHPAAVVKIDNGGPARPQTGLNAADIVVEEEVEGGITRFAAIFHSTPSIVGPIRSGRTTDIGVLNGLGSPLMMYSGANQVTDALIRAQSSVQNRNAGTSSGYWRNSSRRAPSNLYSDTAPHWASATGGPPPPQFAYRAVGTQSAGTDVTAFNVSYRSSKAAWAWDGSAWLRSQGGSAHMTASGQQVSAANVVVIEAEEVSTGMVDSSGANVPEFVFVGTGSATVFTDGKRIDGVWTRPTLRSVATLTTSSGAVIELTPGRTWIELIRARSGILN